MNLFDQFLLKFFSILILFLMILFGIIGVGFFETETHTFIDLIFSSLEARIAFLAIVLLFIMLSLRFLLYGFKRSSSNLTINTRNDLGEMQTSITTFETIAERTVRQVAGVRDSKVRLKVSEVDGHQFYIKVIIDGDVPIPQITEQIQRDVKYKVEEITGVTIQQVSVLISDVISPQAQKARRVE